MDVKSSSSCSAIMHSATSVSMKFSMDECLCHSRLPAFNAMTSSAFYNLQGMRSSLVRRKKKSASLPISVKLPIILLMEKKSNNRQKHYPFRRAQKQEVNRTSWSSRFSGGKRTRDLAIIIWSLGVAGGKQAPTWIYEEGIGRIGLVGRENE